MWPCYEMFTNNTIRTSLNGWGQNGPYKGDMDAVILNRNTKAAIMISLTKPLPA